MTVIAAEGRAGFRNAKSTSVLYAINSTKCRREVRNAVYLSNLRNFEVMTSNTVNQRSCGCVEVTAEPGRQPLLAFRCAEHLPDGERRGLIESDASAILPWDAVLYLHTVLALIGSDVGIEPLDRALLDAAYVAALRVTDAIRPVDELVQSLEHVRILSRESSNVHFAKRWTFDAARNDYLPVE